MKIPLEEAVANATKGPFVVLDGELQTERDVCHLPHSGMIIKTMGKKPDLNSQIASTPFNAALLCHYANHFGELVEALKDCLSRLDDHDEQSAPECLKARAALANASTVEAPDSVN